MKQLITCLPHVPYGPTWWNEPAPTIPLNVAREFMYHTACGRLANNDDGECMCDGDHKYVWIRRSTTDDGHVSCITLNEYGATRCGNPHGESSAITRLQLYRRYVMMYTPHVKCHPDDMIEYLCPLLDEIAPLDEVPL